MRAERVRRPALCPTRRAVLRRLACAAGLAGAMPPVWASPWLPPPALPDLVLLDHEGQPQRLRSDVIRDGVVLVHFFFTGCSTVCPPQTALLRELRQQLDTAHAGPRAPLFVGLSVDPLGDSPAQLRAHLQRFGIRGGREAGWVWLTGQAPVLGRALQAFGVATAAPDAHPNLLWLGDAARQRWTRTAALQAPARLGERLAEVMA